jgi:hypothetical protein
MKLIDLLNLERDKFPDFPAPSQIAVCRHVTHLNPVVQIRMRDDVALLNAYQSEQREDVFGDKRLILAFVPDGIAGSLFLGAFENRQKISVECYRALFPDNPLRKYSGYTAAEDPANVFYELTESPVLENYRKRLVIDWGAGMRRWCQGKLDKEVVEIRSKGYAESFVDYHEVSLPFQTLKTIITHPREHGRWHDKLRSVQAVYLILDEASGEQYVGAAYGEHGLLGRWKRYVETNGHGGNERLVERLRDRPGAESGFIFSILRVFDRGTLKEKVREAETRMKLCLGSRVHGLNAN